MNAPRWIYVFYRGDEVQFVGVERECIEHFNITRDHLKWLATPTARRRADKDPTAQRLCAEKIDWYSV